MLTIEQATKLINCIQENKISQFFEEIDNYRHLTPKISLLKDEFISGRYSFDYYERLQVYINSIAPKQFAIVSPKYDIFFSFSSKNIEYAENTVITLRRSGLTVFFSKDTLREQGGQSFIAKINEALKTSEHFLFLCTPEAIESNYVEYECEIFMNTHIQSGKKRRFFILEGENFANNLLHKFNLAHIQSSRLRDVMLILGKEMPDEIQERKIEYKELFEILFKDGIIDDRERRKLDKEKKNLRLTDEQVMEIEEDIKKAYHQEKQRLEQERLENERIEREKTEQERLEKEAEEKQRLEKERLESERIEREKAEKERLAQEEERQRLEQGRLEKETEEEKSKVQETQLKIEKEDSDNFFFQDFSDNDKVIQEDTDRNKSKQNQTFEKFDSVLSNKDSNFDRVLNFDKLKDQAFQKRKQAQMREFYINLFVTFIILALILLIKCANSI